MHGQQPPPRPPPAPVRSPVPKPHVIRQPCPLPITCSTPPFSPVPIQHTQPAPNLLPGVVPSKPPPPQPPPLRPYSIPVFPSLFPPLSLPISVHSPGSRTPSTRLMPAASRRVPFHSFTLLFSPCSKSPYAYLNHRLPAAVKPNGRRHSRLQPLFCSSMPAALVMAVPRFFCTTMPGHVWNPGVFLSPVQRGPISSLPFFTSQS